MKLQSLEFLEISANEWVDDELITAVCQSLKKLTHIGLSNYFEG